MSPSRNVPPVVHVFGRAASVACELVSELPAPTFARSRNLIVPADAVGCSTAIQYVVPAVTVTPGTVTLFWAFATAPVIVPVVNSVPGWLEALLL
jgi:hypothetical protein